ncbi:hypothetical protein H2O73_03790 [Vibrio sp. 404]|uniref:Uncharacterized protein n=1 Tax=Vibrio marinisediminis TaxID=2758441 RepID=A0A7W2FNZ5_9VIBR|nr:hypothetical protein [Vibrio marinisediminis]MBA5761457.1 hypothetical protein [Vibrio marinisediminis]
MLDSIFNFFNQGWVGSLIGLLGIILGIVGIFSYKISKSAAKPAYQKTSLRLLGREEDNLPDDVTVTYKGLEVQRLTKTTLVVWNNGTEVLDGDAILQRDPLRLEFEDGTNILSYKILKSNRTTNEFTLNKCEQNENRLVVNFLYLDPNDGVTIEILHDSKARYPKFKGTIKGHPKCFEDLGGVVFFGRKITRKSGPLGLIYSNFKLFMLIPILMGIGAVLLGTQPEFLMGLLGKKGGDSSVGTKWEMVIVGFLYIILPAVLLLMTRAKYPKSLKPIDIDP